MLFLPVTFLPKLLEHGTTRSGDGAQKQTRLIQQHIRKCKHLCNTSSDLSYNFIDIVTAIIQYYGMG